MTTWNLQETSCHLLICNGESCKKLGAEEVTTAIREEITELAMDRRIHTTRTRCNGRCADACVVIAYPEGVWYRDLTPEEGKELVRRHATGARLEEKIVYRFDGTLTPTGRSVKGIDKEEESRPERRPQDPLKDG